MSDLHAQLYEHRRTRAEELFTLANLLNGLGVTPDVGPLLEAGSQCLSAIRTASKGLPDEGREYWGYDIVDLRINLDAQRHSRPRAAKMEDVSGTLQVTVQEYLPDAASAIGAGFPHIRRLDADFHFDAVLDVDGTRHPLRAAWHVDTHMHPEGGSHAVHPRFHFQVGGKKLEDVDDAIRGVFLPDAPRLACAPLDGPLAVDFVLSQYCGEHWMLLRNEEPQYGRLRRQPMRRYWEPYHASIAAAIADIETVWDGGEATLLLPNINTG